MSSCLGLYLSDNIVKYAKMTMDNNKNIMLENYGIRFIRGNTDTVLANIIEETNSSKDMIAINTIGDVFVNYTMFDQGSGKSFATDVARMEFESWCEKGGKIPSKYSYSYKISDIPNDDKKYNAVLNIIDKEVLKDYSQVGNTKVGGIMPVQFLMNRLVPTEENDYILINLNDKLSASVVSNNQILDYRFYDFGMKDLLDKFSEKLGSYQKAYDACKQLNVYSDEETNNDKKLEEIAEPVLQEILKSVAILVNKYRSKVNKVILTGHGIVFTNIDILFREYLNIKCDILKPDFIKAMSDVRNVAEALETTQAIALALEGVSPKSPELNYSKMSGKFANKFDNMFKKQQKEAEKVAKKEVRKERFEASENVVLKALTCVAIVTSILFVSYFVFSLMYTKNVTKKIKAVENVEAKYTEQIKAKTSDVAYIDKNKDEYKKINEKVKEVTDDLEESKVSKYTTYNVATFLQNIIKIIPQNVKLDSITSDDNKNIVIKAESSSYSNLGYFVSALKISGTLTNIKIKNVNNNVPTIIEIGGELP